jgi:hypothetical protein
MAAPGFSIREDMMDLRNMLLMLAAITALVLSLLSDNAIAQQKPLKEQLVGTWALVVCEVVAPDGTKAPIVVGSNPAGQYIFTRDGHFSFQAAAELPKFASGEYGKTTPEENKAVAEGSIAYYGTYTANDTERTVTLHIVRSSFPNQNGSDGKRIITALTADEMSYINPARRGGGSINCAYRRAK